MDEKQMCDLSAAELEETRRRLETKEWRKKFFDDLWDERDVRALHLTPFQKEIMRAILDAPLKLKDLRKR